MPVPGVELGIAASLMILGSLVVFAFKPSLPLGMAIVGLFAIFHGHAHGRSARAGRAFADGFSWLTASSALFAQIVVAAVHCPAPAASHHRR